LCRRTVEVRVANESLLLNADPTLTGVINTVLVIKDVRVTELRCCTGQSTGARARRWDPLFALS
jgi:hypothetical protein